MYIYSNTSKLSRRQGGRWESTVMLVVRLREPGRTGFGRNFAHGWESFARSVVVWKDRRRGMRLSLIATDPVQSSGHYMYRTVVTICTSKLSLYVPHSGQYKYCTVVTICTTSLTFTTLRSAHSLYLWVLCGSQNKQPLFPYTTLTDWFL